jgi:hypothetical protein
MRSGPEGIVPNVRRCSALISTRKWLICKGAFGFVLLFLIFLYE